METKIVRYFTISLRVLLAGLFLYAGGVKAMGPGAFLNDIENYQILPHVVAVVISLYLPYLEILCGWCLLFRRLERGALTIMSALMLVFMAALLSAWVRGLDIECGCFGSGGARSHYGMALGRDLAITTALGFLWTRASDCWIRLRVKDKASMPSGKPGLTSSRF